MYVASVSTQVGLNQLVSNILVEIFDINVSAACILAIDFPGHF